MKQVRYINLDKVPPEIFSSMWEVDLVIDITEPTIIRWTADRLLCHFWHGPYNITGPKEDRDMSKDSDGSLWKYREVDISPILTASEISCICFVPGFCLATQPVYMPATAKDAIAAIIGTITSIGKPRIVSVAIVYLKNESLKNINQQEILGEFLFLYGSNVFPRNP